MLGRVGVGSQEDLVGLQEERERLEGDFADHTEAEPEAVRCSLHPPTSPPWLHS